MLHSDFHLVLEVIIQGNFKCVVKNWSEELLGLRNCTSAKLGCNLGLGDMAGCSEEISKDLSYQ